MPLKPDREISGVPERGPKVHGGRGSNVNVYIGAPHGSEVMVPSTGAYKEALSQAAAGMNEITKGVAALGKIGEDIYKKHVETERENIVQAKQLESERQFFEFKTGYDRSDKIDPKNYSKGLLDGFDSIVKTQLGMIKDTKTRQAYGDRMAQRKYTEMPRAYVEQEKRFHNRFYGDTMRNVDECRDMAISTDDPDRSEMFKQMMVEEINKGYPIEPDRAQALENIYTGQIKEGRAKNVEGRVYQDILRDPGGTMQKLMLPPEAGEYSEITEPTKREALRKHAETIFNTGQTERRTERERVDKENHDAEALGIGNLYATGKLKIGHIQEAKYLSGAEKIGLTDKIRERQDRLAKGEIVKTNFSTYARIQDMIYSGQPKREITKRIALASEKDLSEQDAETLLNKSTAYGGHIEDQWRKKSYDFLKSQIAASGTNMLGDFVNPEEAIDFFKATNSLDSAIAKTKQQGKPFSPEQIFEEARKILPLFKRTQKQLAEAAKERMKGEKSKINVPERKKGESASDYLKRTGGE